MERNRRTWTAGGAQALGERGFVHVLHSELPRRHAVSQFLSGQDDVLPGSVGQTDVGHELCAILRLSLQAVEGQLDMRRESLEV